MSERDRIAEFRPADATGSLVRARWRPQADQHFPLPENSFAWLGSLAAASPHPPGRTRLVASAPGAEAQAARGHPSSSGPGPAGRTGNMASAAGAREIRAEAAIGPCKPAASLGLHERCRPESCSGRTRDLGPKNDSGTRTLILAASPATLAEKSPHDSHRPSLLAMGYGPYVRSPSHDSCSPAQPGRTRRKGRAPSPPRAEREPDFTPIGSPQRKVTVRGRR